MLAPKNLYNLLVFLFFTLELVKIHISNFHLNHKGEQRAIIHRPYDFSYFLKNIHIFFLVDFPWSYIILHLSTSVYMLL